MHSDLSRKRRHSVLVVQESLFLPSRSYRTHPIAMGSLCSRSEPKVTEKGRRALRRRPFLATAGSRVRLRCDSRHSAV